MRAWAAVALLAFAAHAAAAPGVRIEDMTWTELRDRIAAGATIALVPIGGTEQNGPHMALGKHNVRARELAARIAARLGNALVAPVIAYVPEGSIDPPSGHMRFPGTIGVPDDAFEAMLASTVRSLRRSGFRDVVLLCDHGGYRRQVEHVAARFAHDGVHHVVALAQYYDAQAGFAAELRRRGFADAEIGSHAGLADTALTMAIDPSLVRADALALPRSAGDGVSGDPRRASAELGRVGVERIVEASVAAVRARTAAEGRPGPSIDGRSKR